MANQPPVNIFNNFQQIKQPQQGFYFDKITDTTFHHQPGPLHSLAWVLRLPGQELPQNRHEAHSKLETIFRLLIPFLSWTSLLYSSVIIDFLSTSSLTSAIMGVLFLFLAFVTHALATTTVFSHGITPVVSFIVAALIQTKILVRIPSPEFSFYFLIHRSIEVSLAFYLLGRYRTHFAGLTTRLLAPTLIAYLALLMTFTRQILPFLPVEFLHDFFGNAYLVGSIGFFVILKRTPNGGQFRKTAIRTYGLIMLPVFLFTFLNWFSYMFSGYDIPWKITDPENWVMINLSSLMLSAIVLAQTYFPSIQPSGKFLSLVLPLLVWQILQAFLVNQILQNEITEPPNITLSDIND